MKKTDFIEDFPLEIVKEGKAQVSVPRLSAYRKTPSDYAPSKAPVFYNPVMELNRDLAVLVARVYQKRANREISFCEPLAGSGIRGVRVANEVNNVKVTIGDINEHAFQLAKRNVALNGLEDRIIVLHEEANCLLSCHSSPLKRFDIIDVDPFGSPVRYLESAIRALRRRGVLALTATDLAPLCGVHIKACLRKYGGKPLRTEYCQELAVRLLVGCLASTAARQDVGTRVLLGISTDHYVRVYVEVNHGSKNADESLRNLGYVRHCFNCLHRETAATAISIEKCPECGQRMDHAGPLWIGIIGERSFCELLKEENKRVAFRNSSRIEKLLSLVEYESEAPACHYVVDVFGSKLHIPEPSTSTIIKMLRNCGFEAGPTHFNSRGFRTNAPASEIYQLFRQTSKTA